MKSNKKPGQIYATISVSIVLLLVCLFLLLYFHTGNITNLVKERINLIVELQDNIPEGEIKNITQSIASYEGVVPGSAQYISKEEAQKIMAEEMMPVSGGLENPFKDIIKFNLKADYYTEKHLEELKSKLNLEKGVLSFHYENESIDSVKENILKLSYFILLLSGVFSFLVLIIIHNTVRLNLYNDLREIKTMQMVGAENFFIKKPYLRNAFFMTTKASVFVLVLIALLYLWVQFSDNIFKEVLGEVYILLSLIISFIIGFVIIIFSTNGILNRFLRNEIK